MKQVKAKKLNESASKPVPQPTRVSERPKRATAAATLAALEASTRKEKADSEGDEDEDDAEDEAVQDSSDDEADNGEADPGEFVGEPPEADADEDTVMDVDAEAVAVEPEPEEIEDKEISESAGGKDNGITAPLTRISTCQILEHSLQHPMELALQSMRATFAALSPTQAATRTLWASGSTSRKCRRRRVRATAKSPSVSGCARRRSCSRTRRSRWGVSPRHLCLRSPWVTPGRAEFGS